MNSTNKNLVLTDAISRFIEKCFDQGVNLRSFIIYQNNQLAAKVAFAPYSTTDKQQLYSVSKSFTSTAIGFAVEEGIVSVEDHVIDIFPELLPEQVSNNLKLMKVSHLLSMNTGHDEDTTRHILGEKDAIKAFLEFPVKHKPGAHFLYNTGATFMLSAIITKVSGASLLEYLMPRLFDKIGIKNIFWGKNSQNINYGGFDLYINNEDLSKFGLLYLNKGIYDNKQILPEKWIEEATSKISDNSSIEGSIDWSTGYGYQFWKNDGGGYRADGAYGQICLIRPDKNIVFSVFAETHNMQAELTLMQELVNNFNAASDLGLVNDQKYTPLSGDDGSLNGIWRNIYYSKSNVLNIKSIKFSKKENIVTWRFTDGESDGEIHCGLGSFVSNKIYIKRLIPKIFVSEGKDKECARFAASCQVKKGSLYLEFRYFNVPHVHQIKCTFDESNIKMVLKSTFNFYGLDKKTIRGNL